MKYRNRTDVAAQILEVANNGRGTAKTMIMYGAFLSHAQLQEYLVALEQNDLLEYDPAQQTYKTSGKGKRFLDFYNKIDQSVGPQRTIVEH